MVCCLPLTNFPEESFVFVLVPNLYRDFLPSFLSSGIDTVIPHFLQILSLIVRSSWNFVELQFGHLNITILFHNQS